MRQLISSGAPWEDIVGYSRAVRVGNIIEVAGTTAVENGEVVGKDDAYAQSVCIFQKIARALEEAGASMQNVVRTRMYVTNIERDWEGIGKAHGEFLKTVKPASTMVEVQKLMTPEMLVEIEVTAILQ